jgi:hypothetical protein
MVLAIYASQVATCKEDVAYAIVTAYRRLFSSVDAYRCNVNACILSTIASSSLKSVHSAFTWT